MVSSSKTRSPIAPSRRPGGFAFVIPEGSVLTAFGLASGERFPAVADGYWIMLEGLRSGEHTIHIFAQDINGNTQDVTWTISIRHSRH